MAGNTPPCPRCGEKLPEDTIWVLFGKFYCSEKCCQEVARGKR